jgi:hypothetical protein
MSIVVGVGQKKMASKYVRLLIEWTGVFVLQGMLWGGWCRKSKQRSYAVLTRRGENSSGQTDSAASGGGQAQRKAEEGGGGGGLTELGGPPRRSQRGWRSGGPRETRLGGQSPDISNSSLKDVDREALRDELASYTTAW